MPGYLPAKHGSTLLVTPIESYSPVDGKLIGTVQPADQKSYEAVIAKAQEAFLAWRQWPAPKEVRLCAR